MSTERGRMMAEEHGLKFIETSAQTGENVELAFLTLAKDIKYQKDLETETTSAIASSDIESRLTRQSSCLLY